MPESESTDPGGIEPASDLVDSEITRAAWDFAAAAHGDQRRKGDGAPYMAHPLEVARLVVDHGGNRTQVAAAFLHDVLEDTETAGTTIEDRFGPEVAALVAALSDDPAIADYEARKAALREQVEAAGAEAQQIYAADKLANSRELLRVYRSEGEAVAPRYKAPLDVRLAIWRADLAMVRGRLGDAALVGALEGQLDELENELVAASA